MSRKRVDFLAGYITTLQEEFLMKKTEFVGSRLYGFKLANGVACFQVT